MRQTDRRTTDKRTSGLLIEPRRSCSWFCWSRRLLPWSRPGRWSGRAGRAAMRVTRPAGAGVGPFEAPKPVPPSVAPTENISRGG
jgi:hypothetical protein